ncbi:Asparagine--tRNA ligase [Klebsiella pneumoniae]|nr:Asparagine--tRNA ligase [Klebsiella pneumoniae]
MSVVPVADVLRAALPLTAKSRSADGCVPAEILKLAFLSSPSMTVPADPVQAVINNSLPNYNQEVLRLTTGCSVIVTGKVVASQGQGQSFEIRRPAWK